MANFGQLMLTNSGLQAQVLAQSGATLEFSKIKMGDGTFNGNISSLKNLVNTKASMDISNGYIQNKAFILEGVFSNGEVTTGFYWREIGVFIKDTNGNDVLYAYANAGSNYDYIPATEDEKYTKRIRIATAVGDAKNITITESEGIVFVDTLTFESTVEDLKDTISFREADVFRGFKIVDGNEYAGVASDYGIDIGAIDGNSEQKTTNGYQLLDARKLADLTTGGATLKNNGDGSFTISGSGTLTADFISHYRIETEEARKLFKAGNVYLAQGGSAYPRIVVNAYFDGENSKSLNGTDNNSFDLTDEIINKDDFCIIIYISGVTGQNIIPGTIKPMLYQDGNGEWEEFTGGMISPSASYPQEIKSFGDEVVRFNSHGFQLFDQSKIPTYSSGGVTATNNGDGSYTISGSDVLTDTFAVHYRLIGDEARKLFKPGNLYLKQNGTTYPRVIVNVYYDGANNLSLDGNSNRHVTLTEEIINKDDFIVLIYISGVTGQSVVEGTIKPMLYQDGDGTWEEYKEVQSTEVALTAPLRSLPNGVKDTYVNGVITRRVGEVTLDGSENWSLDEYGRYFVTISDLKPTGDIYAVPTLMCDKFLAVNKSTVSVGECRQAASETARFFYVNYDNGAIGVDAFKTWLASNPVTVSYELATPTTETVELPTIPSYNPHTVVHHDSEVLAGGIKWNLNMPENEVEKLLARPVNNNILINSNFANPVNQRGSSNYVFTNNPYTIDRWRLVSDNGNTSIGLTVNNDYITLSSDISTGQIRAQLYQKIEFPEIYAGKRLCPSLKYRVTSGVYQEVSLCVSAVKNSETIDLGHEYLICDGEWNECAFIVDVPDGISELVFNIGNQGVANCNNLSKDLSIDIKWVKLELGDHATPYVPRLYAEELQLCQRYYQKIPVVKSSLVKIGTNEIDFETGNYYTLMRSSPTVTSKDIVIKNNATTIADFSITYPYIYANNLLIRCTKTSHGLSSSKVLSLGGSIMLDAEL